MNHNFYILLLLSAFSASAQNSNTTFSQKQVRIHYGKAFHVKTDHTYSRVPKRGFSHYITAEYENINATDLIGVNIEFMSGDLNTKTRTKNSYNTIYNYGGSLEYRHLKQVHLNNKFAFFSGTNLGLRSEVWFPKEALAYGWDINASVGSASTLLYALNPKFTLRYNLDIPLLGVLWRSPNNGQQLITEEKQLTQGILASGFSTPIFSNPFNAFYCVQSFTVQYRLSENIDLQYRFNTSYRNIKPPLIKKGYDITNALGMHYNF